MAYPSCCGHAGHPSPGGPHRPPPMQYVPPLHETPHVVLVISPGRGAIRGAIGGGSGNQWLFIIPLLRCPSRGCTYPGREEPQEVASTVTHTVCQQHVQLYECGVISVSSASHYKVCYSVLDDFVVCWCSAHEHTCKWIHVHIPSSRRPWIMP